MLSSWKIGAVSLSGIPLLLCPHRCPCPTHHQRLKPAVFAAVRLKLSPSFGAGLEAALVARTELEADLVSSSGLEAALVLGAGLKGVLVPGAGLAAALLPGAGVHGPHSGPASLLLAACSCQFPALMAGTCGQPLPIYV